MFEMTHLYEDSLREYDELEIYYLQTGARSISYMLIYFVLTVFFSSSEKYS